MMVLPLRAYTFAAPTSTFPGTAYLKASRRIPYAPYLSEDSMQLIQVPSTNALVQVFQAASVEPAGSYRWLH